MTVLTDNECREIYNGAMAMPERSVVQTMRVIEAAVLAKLSAEFELPEPDIWHWYHPAHNAPDYVKCESYTAEQLRAAYAAGAAAQRGADKAEVSGPSTRPPC